MDIFIKWNNDTNGFKLPVNPESYQLNGKQQNTAVNIHAIGELNLKGKRALNVVQWGCFFPAQAYSFCVDTPRAPMSYISDLTQLMNDNTTVHVVIGDRVNMFATIESINWGEDDRSGDINYDISFKEDRGLETGKRVSKQVDGTKYVWKKKDTWNSVCKKNLGDASYAAANKAANQSVIDKAMKAYKKRTGKKGKENVALVGYTVVLKK